MRMISSVWLGGRGTAIRHQEGEDRAFFPQVWGATSLTGRQKEKARPTAPAPKPAGLAAAQGWDSSRGAGMDVLDANNAAGRAERQREIRRRREEVFRDSAQGRGSGSSELGAGHSELLSPSRPQEAPALDAARLVV